MSGSTPSPTPIRFGLLTKMVFAIVLAGFVPLLVLSINSLTGYRTASTQAAAIAKSALDDKSTNSLRLQAVAAAQQISLILNEAVEDSFAAALLPRTPAAYQQFYNTHQHLLRYPVYHTNNEVVSQLTTIPTYREMVYIDASGQEQIRLVDGQLLPAEALRNVSRVDNTTYKTERYFAEAAFLRPGDIYVSPVSAWHITNPAQPAQAYANLPPGFSYNQYEAVIRFAVPLFTPEGAFDGVVLLALDHRHVMEKVVHIRPLSETPIAWADYESGDYAFMFDFEGYTIAHPLLNRVRGFDDRGRLAPYTPQMSREEQQNYPFNMLYSSNDPSFAKIYQDVLSGKIDTTIATNASGVRKVTAYAPIHFTYGVYEQSGVFGGVTIGASLDRFNQAAERVGESIEQERTRLQTLLLVSSLGCSLLLFAVAFLLARHIINPVLQLTKAAEAMEQGEFDRALFEQLGHQRLADEVTTLSHVFKKMAQSVQMREKRLKEQVQELKIQIDDARKQQQVQEIVGTEYFSDLQKNATQMRERMRRRKNENDETLPPAESS